MGEETIIITGGNGFVGRHLAGRLKQEKGVRVVVWDRSVEGVDESVEGVEMDITKPETYRESLREERPAWLVHLAAVPSAALASQNEERAWQVNVEGTRQLLEEARRVSPGTRVLAISSADIYGQGSSTPLPELPLAEARPRNAYAQTKWEMEQLIEKRRNDKIIRVRPFPHIGPGQALGYVTADFASQIALIEKGEQEPALRVGNLEARRDFTDARDVVRAYRLLMERGRLGEVYNVASGRAVSIRQVLDKLLSLSGEEIMVEQDKSRLRPADVPVSVGDASKLRRATGWRPEISLDRSLADILNFWREKCRGLVTSN